MFLATIAMLTCWTVVDDFGYHRTEVDETSGESIGECHSENMWNWFIPMAVCAVIPTILAFIMAWKTKDVDDSYSETWWIFAMILIQLEVSGAKQSIKAGSGSRVPTHSLLRRRPSLFHFFIFSKTFQRTDDTLGLL
jgi:hypothetical protein